MGEAGKAGGRAGAPGLEAPEARTGPANAVQRRSGATAVDPQHESVSPRPARHGLTWVDREIPAGRELGDADRANLAARIPRGISLVDAPEVGRDADDCHEKDDEKQFHRHDPDWYSSVGQLPTPDDTWTSTLCQ